MNNSGGGRRSDPMASIYVGDLHLNVTEGELYEKFSSAGRVLSVRICRDIVTQRSLGHAYVKFQQAAEAERALHTFNFDRIHGRSIRIMWSKRDPTIQRSGIGNVFIKNLDKSIDNKTLYDTFSEVGNILSCKIVTGEDGDSKGFGYVHFESEEAAKLAIKNVNGMLLNGKEVYVSGFMNHKDRMQILNQKSTNVFIKFFNDSFDDDKLKALFDTYGRIVSSKVMAGDRKGRGFGFVSFQDAESAQKAVDDLDGKVIDGRKIHVSGAQKTSERQAELKEKYEKMKLERNNGCQSVNLYVKNLDDKINTEALYQAFNQFGTITSAKVMCESRGKDGKPGRSKGFGFVCFTSPEEATKAITEMNGKMLVSKPLYVTLAQRKEDREAQLAAQYKQREAQLIMQGQIFQSKAWNAGFFYPTMPQASQRFFDPQQISTMRPSPHRQISQQMGATYHAGGVINGNMAAVQNTALMATGQMRPTHSGGVAQQHPGIFYNPNVPTLLPGEPQASVLAQVPSQQVVVVQGQEPLNAAMLAGTSGPDATSAPVSTSAPAATSTPAAEADNVAPPAVAASTANE